MATPTTANGKATFQGEPKAITTFISLNNLFLASHPKSMTKNEIRYYTNLYTNEEKPRFLTNFDKLIEYTKNNRTFILDASGRNDYTKNIQYQLKWLIQQIVTTSNNPEIIEILIDEIKSIINSGIKIYYEFTDDNFTEWDKWEGTVDLADAVISMNTQNTSYLNIENIKIVNSSNNWHI